MCPSLEDEVGLGMIMWSLSLRPAKVVEAEVEAGVACQVKELVVFESWPEVCVAAGQG